MFRRLFGKGKTRAPEDPAQAVASGDYDAALEMYGRRLKRDPRGKAGWHKKIGEVLAMAGRKREAVASLLAAAEQYEREDLNLKAIAIYKAALRLDPGNAEVQRRLGEFAISDQERKETEDPGQDIGSMTIRTRLRKFAPLFSELDRESLGAVVEVMQAHSIEVGKVVFRQGESGDSLFIIVQGQIALTVEGAEGEPVELQRLRDGDCFGEVSAISRVPRNTTAIATVPTELLEISRDYLEAVSIAHPQIWATLERYQQRRLVPVGI